MICAFIKLYFCDIFNVIQEIITMQQLAVLWDIENVTPKSDSSFLQDLFEFLEHDDCKISSSICFGDWTRFNLKKVSTSLFEKNFELVHVPRSRKNSADISLITHATEMIFLYPHLNRFVLITGDADFRPLLQTLRKHGKETWVICDAGNASEDLLALADKYFDYRSIGTDYNDEPDAAAVSEIASSVTKENAFQLFQEAVNMMLKQKKTPSLGSVKVKMKLLNENFDERTYGYSGWKEFALDAMSKTQVSLDPENKNNLLLKTSSIDESLPVIFQKLLATLPKTGDWLNFSRSSQLLNTAQVNLKQFGYNRYKSLIIDAEKRNLVETKYEDMTWFVRKKQ